LKIIKENINKINENNVKHSLKNYDSAKIIQLYSDIEKIEKEVLFSIEPLTGENELIHIENVNKKLTVLNNYKNNLQF